LPSSTCCSCSISGLASLGPPHSINKTQNPFETPKPLNNGKFLIKKLIINYL